VVGVADLPFSALDNQEIIVDGNMGQIYLRPDPALRQAYTALIEEERKLSESLSALQNLPAKTPDGDEVVLYTNTGLAAELSLATTGESAGVGLFRSED
jgi:phosphotransferase system enzyme I (PtsP)